MKKIIPILFSISISAITLSSCTPAETGTVAGAATGAGIGYAASGTVGGTLIGAGAGALVGNAIGQSAYPYSYYDDYGYYY